MCVALPPTHIGGCTLDVGRSTMDDGLLNKFAARRATPGMHRRLARVTKTSSSFSAEAVVGRAL